MPAKRTHPGEYRTVIKDSGDPGYVNRMMIGTAVTGLVRVEWVRGRYGQIIPVNWSSVQVEQMINSYMPLRYQVDDAQNLIVKQAVEMNFEWLLLIEHDVVLPPNAFVTLNKYMVSRDVPVVSGLYYTRARPSEPLLFRGRGNGCYYNWKMGDKVWVDGVPTGILLIHNSILRAMWQESEEYAVANEITRRIFYTPRDQWFDPETAEYHAFSGTSDLWWCTRVMKERFFEKAGWPEYQKKKYPFLVDTGIFCPHINQDGEQFP